MCLCHVPKSKGLVCVSHKPIMKCIRNNKTGQILRVKDTEAAKATKSGWEYIPKSEWKAEKNSKKVNPHNTHIKDR